MYKRILGGMCLFHELRHLYSLDKSSCNSSVVTSEQYSVSGRPLYGSEIYHTSVFPNNYGFEFISPSAICKIYQSINCTKIW